MNRQNEFAVVITSWGYHGTKLPISGPQVATIPTDAAPVVHSTPQTRPEATEVDDLVAMFEQSPEDKKGMASARRWLAKTLDERELGTIKALRLQAGLSQEALARSVGLQQPNISAIEAGKRRPEYETAQKLAKALEVTVENVYAAFNKATRAEK